MEYLTETLLSRRARRESYIRKWLNARRHSTPSHAQVASEPNFQRTLRRHTDISFPAKVLVSKLYQLRIQFIPAEETFPGGEVRERPKPHLHDATVKFLVSPQSRPGLAPPPVRVSVSVAAENFESSQVSETLTRIGYSLFEQLLPRELQELYWTIRGRNVRSVLILSDEPHIPWELIKPYRDNPATGQFEEGEFWGQSYALTHWLRGRAPARRFSFNRVCALAPRAGASTCGGEGTTRDMVPDAPSIASQTGQPGDISRGFSLTRLGSWGARLVYLGCGGFVGTFWPVSDRAALAFAGAFYREMTSGHPIGEAMLRARQHVRERHPDDPTWLAYCCFADPLARIEVPPRKSLEA